MRHRAAIPEASRRFGGPWEGVLVGSGLALLGATGGMYVEDSLVPRHLDPEHPSLGIVVYCPGFLLLCATGFASTYRNWKRDRAPLLAEIQKMKRELMVDETNELPSEHRAEPDTPVVLASFANELEAAAAVTALNSQGVEASIMGGYIAGYRAEAPGDVHIVVRSRDLERAREALADIRATHTDVDWSQVDVGDPEDE